MNIHININCDSQLIDLWDVMDILDQFNKLRKKNYLFDEFLLNSVSKFNLSISGSKFLSFCFSLDFHNFDFRRHLDNYLLSDFFNSLVIDDTLDFIYDFLYLFSTNFNLDWKLYFLYHFHNIADNSCVWSLLSDWNCNWDFLLMF